MLSLKHLVNSVIRSLQLSSVFIISGFPKIILTLGKRFVKESFSGPFIATGTTVLLDFTAIIIAPASKGDKLPFLLLVPSGNIAKILFSAKISKAFLIALRSAQPHFTGKAPNLVKT